MSSKIYCYIILMILVASPKAFSNSPCEGAFSKALSYVKHEMEAMGLKFRKNTRSFSPSPSTSLLKELQMESTRIRFSFSTYHSVKLEYGDSRFLQKEYLYEDFLEETNHSMRNIGDSYYWSRYVPRRKRPTERYIDYTGQFVIGFAIKLQSSHPDRSGYFYHRIHWDSGAKDKKLDPETVRAIFTKIYGASPEAIATEFQSKYIEGGDVSRAEVDKLIAPFLQDDVKAEQVKRVILRMLQRRGHTF